MRYWRNAAKRRRIISEKVNDGWLKIYRDRVGPMTEGVVLC